jgi:hypothetical protein
MKRIGLEQIKDFLTGESRRRAEEEVKRARLEEIDDIRLAGNPCLSEAEYLRLANSPYPFVRIALGYNPNIPDGAIQIPAKDSDPIVRDRAMEIISPLHNTVFSCQQTKQVIYFNVLERWPSG